MRHGMLRSVHVSLLAALLIGVPLAAGPMPQAARAQASKAQGKKAPAVNATAAAIADFRKRIDAYVASHRKLEDTLPKLSTQTNPQEIDAHQRALGTLMQEARKTAKPGDLLTPAMQRVVRTILRPIFSGLEGTQVKSEILDKEDKTNAKLVVNGRYPDDVPISTVPPQVLASLPKLPEELEYRFIQNSLILFDSHAHIIVDFMDRAFI
jgi:hypothetical protein